MLKQKFEQKLKLDQEQIDYSNHQLLEESCDIDMMIGLERGKLLKGQLGDEK
jgi:hypothetical protein